MPNSTGSLSSVSMTRPPAVLGLSPHMSSLGGGALKQNSENQLCYGACFLERFFFSSVRVCDESCSCCAYCGSIVFVGAALFIHNAAKATQG